MSGLFISFEGGEGAGKSTQVPRLAERLRAAGHDVLTTREPGGTPGAEAIRALFTRGAAGRWTPAADALLVSAARADHVARFIRPALEAGRTVITDRFVHSTYAYQGHGEGLPLADLEALHRFGSGGLLPDRVLWLDFDPAVGVARARSRRGAEERFEGAALAFHARVRAGFAALAAADPRIARIDASRSVEQVAADVWAAVVPLATPRPSR